MMIIYDNNIHHLIEMKYKNKNIHVLINELNDLI